MDVFQLSVPAWQLVARCVVIDVVLLVALRVFGKRQVGQFTLYDLVLILLVANAVQPAMTGPDSSLTGGVIIIAGLVFFNWLLGQLDRVHLIHRLLFAEPRVVIRDGQYLEDALRSEGLDHDEIDEAIREHGVPGVGQVKLGMLESDGNISIIANESRGRPARRKVRYVRRG
jgi:uncharacterized membrane protein YcaP (DUF421 family)